MNQPVRWVTKADAAEELKVSLSTLDRMIRKGEVEVRRERRRVYVRMEGPEFTTEEDLLRRAIIRESELERTVRELEGSTSELEERALELERERDEAREVVAAGRWAYAELQEAYRKEQAEHKDTKQIVIMLRVTAIVLLALLIGSVLLWWFVLR